MKTAHKIYFDNSKNMGAIPAGTAHLVVTSPPYPMIKMWDDMFSDKNRNIAKALDKNDGLLAFELMHRRTGSCLEGNISNFGRWRYCLYQHRRCDPDHRR